MENNPKTYTTIVIAISLIIVGTLILFTNWNNIFDSNEEQGLLQPLRTEVIQQIKDFKMKKLIRENRDLILRKENFTQISNYQKYVTPDHPVITDYLSSNNIATNQQAYSQAVQWIWVSDQTLHNKSEHWMLPFEFIQDTPGDPDNPVDGTIVSDCESQAYTLVSLIETLGTSKGNIRVVVGKVNFSGEIGGHAWVQKYQNNQWYELEPTSGPFWDDEDNQLVNNPGFSFNYFKTHPYPVVEYWAYFNDRYYYNPNNGKKSADLPSQWLTTTQLFFNS